MILLFCFLSRLFLAQSGQEPPRGGACAGLRHVRREKLASFFVSLALVSLTAISSAKKRLSLRGRGAKRRTPKASCALAKGLLPQYLSRLFLAQSGQEPAKARRLRRTPKASCALAKGSLPSSYSWSAYRAY